MYHMYKYSTMVYTKISTNSTNVPGIVFNTFFVLRGMLMFRMFYSLRENLMQLE